MVVLRSILSLAFFLAAVTHAEPQRVDDELQQRPFASFSTNFFSNISTTRATTIVDVLSNSPEHTHVLRLLQRAKLIPTMNQINGSTFFAPTNEAIERELNKPDFRDTNTISWSSSNLLKDVWMVESSLKLGEEFSSVAPDNLSVKLRQFLLYHLLNYTLPYPLLLPESPLLPVSYETLLFPNSTTTGNDSSPRLPEPWLPAPPSNGGQLSFEGQRVRIAVRYKDGVDGDSKENGSNKTYLGVDSFGNGGVQLQELGQGGNATNGRVISIDGVLEVPRDLASILLSHPSLSYLAKLLTPSPNKPDLPNFLEKLSSSPHLTLFLPSDKAWGSLDRVERNYLESGFAIDDIHTIVGGHVVESGIDKKQHVGWRENVLELKGAKTSVTTLSKNDLLVRLNKKNELIVGENALVSEPDILASNGVLHIVDDLLIPPGTFKLNPGKVLIGLNATRFVTLLRTANLSSYIDSSALGEAYTFLAPLDALLSLSHARGDVVPDDGSEALADLLKYHIIPGRLRPKDLEDGLLLGTELRGESMKNGRQKLKVIVTGDDEREKRKGNGDVAFGEGNVVADPVEIGKSVIYLVSQFNTPPVNAIQTAVSDLRLSTFVAAAYAAELDEVFKTAPGVSYFIPRNKAFTQLGLVMNYLLMSGAKADLRKLIEYHAVDEIIYLEDPTKTTQKYPTLEGSPIFIDRDASENGTLYLRGPVQLSTNLTLNGEIRPAQILEGDILTASGTISVIDQVELPPDLQITLAKLVKGTKSSTMADLMVKAGLGWVLDGTVPSEEQLECLGLTRFRAEPEALPPPSFVLLYPSDQAFARVNLTYYLNDHDALVELLKLHILPSESLQNLPRSVKLPPLKDGSPLSVLDDVPYKTLLSSVSKYGDLSFRSTGDNEFVVGIKGARGTNGLNDWARIISHGRATPIWPDVTGGDNDDGHDQLSLRAASGLPEGMSLGGGILTVDSVLIPYRPSFLVQWGWKIFWSVLGGIGGLLILGGLGFWLWSRRQKRGVDYEPLENEED